MLVQKLSRVAEALFDRVADDLAKTRAAANDAITLWPDKAIPGNSQMDFHQKEQLNAHLVGADHATNTLPYKRLKTAMDAWCALWLWPLDKAHLLPNRREFLEGMRLILDGGFSADGSLAMESTADIKDPSPDFFDQLEPDAPARDLFGAAAKRQTKDQDTLFRETNVEALVETFDWLGVAVEVAERERFVHFDLIFADVMRARGGFDVIVGNPPWAKPSWNEGLVLADIDPLHAGLSASDAKKVLAEALPKAPSVRREGRTVPAVEAFLQDFVSTRGAMEVTSSEVMNPFAGGGGNNLYRCFIDLSFRLVAPAGNAALIHQDGHLGDPNSGTFRRHWYARVAKHFNFINMIASKNFSEIALVVQFSLNIYRGEAGDICFEQFTLAHGASQVDDSFLHDGAGEIPPLRNKENKWELAGHRDRISMIDRETLLAIHALSETENVPIDEARFIQPYSNGILTVFEKLARFPKLDEKNSSMVSKKWHLNRLWDETGSQKRGIIKYETKFRDLDETIIQGPMFFVGNPLFKTPRASGRGKENYDVIDLMNLPIDYVPRSNFGPACERSIYASQLTRNRWDPTSKHTDYFRVAFRNMINLTSERSLIAALIPPGVAHVHAVESCAIADSKSLLNLLTMSCSLPFDFLIKVSGRGGIFDAGLAAFPWVDLPDSALIRALRLSCLTEAYAPFWNEVRPQLKVSDAESDLVFDIPNLKSEDPGFWGYHSAIRSELARRQALIEIDVLTSQAIGLTLQQLIDMYRVHFPVLQKKESNTYYDQRGQIVWISAKGMGNVGWVDQAGKKTTRAAWEKILADNPVDLTCTAIDDTMPGGPRTVTRHFVGPFTQCDRIEDYRRAWAHFERLKSEEAA